MFLGPTKRLLLIQELYNALYGLFSCINCIIVNINEICEVLDLSCSHTTFRLGLIRVLLSYRQ